MKRTIIAGNWKMNKNHLEAAALAGAIVEGLAGAKTEVEAVLIPPFTSLSAVAQVVRGTAIAVGAQDIYTEDAGAFTGEISGPMLSALGCTYVLVGHSERRHVIGEGAGLLAGKLRAALRAGIAPIYCVGELLEEREAGRARDVVEKQMREVLEGLPGGDWPRIAIAYEPVWAIGTGRTATPRDASEMHAAIRCLLGNLFGGSAADSVPILYGGSVKPESSAGLLADPEINGLLVGGASLEAGSFLAILHRQTI